MKPRPSSTSSAIGWSAPYFGIAALIAVVALYAGVVTLADWLLAIVGGHTPGLETHLLLINFAALRALGDGEGIWVGTALLATAAFRWVRRGFAVDAAVLLPPISLAVIVVAVLHAQAARIERSARHFAALEASVAKGERKPVRELIFACEAFCGFDEDPGPLIWLVAEARELADMNAIGQLIARGARRDEHSRRGGERRTAIEVAVDRHTERPDLLPYLLGLDRLGYDIHVHRAPSRQLDLALKHALGGHGTTQAVELLREYGAEVETPAHDGKTGGS